MILSVLKIILNFETVTYKCKLLIFKTFVSPISRADRSVSIVFEVKDRKRSTFLADTIYVFDKGYVSYRKWETIDAQGAFWVTRINQNAK